MRELHLRDIPGIEAQQVSKPEIEGPLIEPFIELSVDQIDGLTLANPDERAFACVGARSRQGQGGEGLPLLGF
jgi:hypothetical protein